MKLQSALGLSTAFGVSILTSTQPADRSARRTCRSSRRQSRRRRSGSWPRLFPRRSATPSVITLIVGSAANWTLKRCYNPKVPHDDWAARSASLKTNGRAFGEGSPDEQAKWGGHAVVGLVEPQNNRVFYISPKAYKAIEVLRRREQPRSGEARQG
jgi:hypothetical protein